MKNVPKKGPCLVARPCIAYIREYLPPGIDDNLHNINIFPIIPLRRSRKDNKGYGFGRGGCAGMISCSLLMVLLEL